MNHNNLAWRPLNTKELLAGLALFVLPIFSPILKIVFGYKAVINNIGYVFTLTILIIGLVVIILGIKNGFPRWSIPYLGVSIITIIMLQAVFPLWGLFATDVKRIIKYYTKTLLARIQYSALLNGFFWLMPFIVLIIIVVAPADNRVIEEYAYDEAWKIACRVCLALGAWIYFKTADQRKRILTLIAGVTLTYWIAAIGKWIVLPQQSWSAWYGYDHWTYRRFELGSTLSEWVWVLFFMLVPAVLTLIPLPKKSDPIPEEAPTPV